MDVQKVAWQLSCTYVVHLHVQWFFVCLPVILTMLPKEENWLNPYIPKIIIISWWTELTKMIKLWLWLRITGLRRLSHLKKIVSCLGVMFDNFINIAILSNDISWDLNVLEKFLLVMINLTLFLSLPSPLLLFFTCFLCELCLILKELEKLF